MSRQIPEGKERKMNGRFPAKTRTFALVLGLLFGALVLAGCGGSSGASSGSSTTAGTSGSTTEGRSKPGGFEISDEESACLKEKGVELPEFKGGAGGPPAGGEGGEPPEGVEPPAGGEMPEGSESSGEAPPTGAGGPGGEGFTEMRQAFEECGIESPGFEGEPGGEGVAPVKSAVFRKQVRRYAACVRKNGYELAAPNFSGEGPVFKQSESESAAFKKASAKCQSLLGGPIGGPGSEGNNET
ncbi:MAG: hypothetical protein JST08_14845 [Actinobacteria bacterium]|nr:hypothetical protein [Actinomycetota bacterium]